MAITDIYGSSSAAQQTSLLRPQGPADQAAGSDNRTVGNQGQAAAQPNPAQPNPAQPNPAQPNPAQRSVVGQAPVNAATEAAQRPTIADGNGGSRPTGSAASPFGDATRVEIRSQPQAANGNSAPNGGNPASGIQVNFNSSGTVNTATNPNQAGRNVSLSV